MINVESDVKDILNFCPEKVSVTKCDNNFFDMV